MQTCPEKLGLKTIGPVKETVVVVPAIQMPGMNPAKQTDLPERAQEHSDASGSIDTYGIDAPRAEKIKPANPLLESFLR